MAKRFGSFLVRAQVCVTILIRSQPLKLWSKEVQNGHIHRLTDEDIQSFVIEILGANVSTTFITCPFNRQSLAIKLPILVMTVKNVSVQKTLFA